MCNALHCWWSQYEDDHHRTVLLSLSKSGRRDICSFAPIFLRYKLNVMYKNWFQIFAQWTKPGRTSYFEVWCLKFTNIDNPEIRMGQTIRILGFKYIINRIYRGMMGRMNNMYQNLFYGSHCILVCFTMTDCWLFLFGKCLGLASARLASRWTLRHQCQAVGQDQSQVGAASLLSSSVFHRAHLMDPVAVVAGEEEEQEGSQTPDVSRESSQMWELVRHLFPGKSPECKLWIWFDMLNVDGEQSWWKS